MLKKAWSDYWSSWSWKTFIKRNKGGGFLIWYMIIYPFYLVWLNRDAGIGIASQVIDACCWFLWVCILLFALISQRCVLLYLPKQMFLCPMTRKEREEYMTKMLQLKIIIPFTVSLIGSGALAIIRKFRFEFFLAVAISFLVYLIATNITAWPGSVWRVKYWEGNYTSKNKHLKGLTHFGTIAIVISVLLEFVLFFGMEPADQMMIEFRLFVLIMILIQAIVAIGILSYTKRVIAIGCDYEYSLQGIDELNKARGESI